MAYEAAGIPAIVLAGREYGSGSSRDWAAKGTRLLGIRAVIAESYERIHRSNLVGMGILPLQFAPGVSAESLGLTGAETFDVVGLAAGLTPRHRATVVAYRSDGSDVRFEMTVRIDEPAEVEAFRHGGILRMVLRQMLAG
jgi:aconitate hydratase